METPATYKAKGKLKQKPTRKTYGRRSYRAYSCVLQETPGSPKTRYKVRKGATKKQKLITDVNVEAVEQTIKGVAQRIYATLDPRQELAFYERALLNGLHQLNLQTEWLAFTAIICENPQSEKPSSAVLAVADAVLVEIAPATSLNPTWSKDFLGQLNLQKIRLGLLINFGASNPTDVVRRVTNKLK